MRTVSKKLYGFFYKLAEFNEDNNTEILSFAPLIVEWIGESQKAADVIERIQGIFCGVSLFDKAWADFWTRSSVSSAAFSPSGTIQSTKVLAIAGILGMGQ
jgi:hypothetical protein